MTAPSDKYEHDVAANINGSIKGLVAERPRVSTSFPDVRVEYGKFTGSKAVWVEVKMNHTDNLMNPRYTYANNTWQAGDSYKSPATDILDVYFNKSKEAQEWIDGLKVFLAANNYKGDIRNLTLYSTTTERKTDKNTVSLELMKQYLKTRANKNICKVPKVDVGKVVTLHYLEGKAVAAYYVSAGNDFYQFGKTNPLKIPGVPVFVGVNSVVLRVGDRSSNFEIQAEVKLKSIASSPYSVKPGTSKPNPFKAIK
jgi:hypothetical protein